MYANVHTIIFTFTLIFFILEANRLQKTCKQTAKKGKTNTASPFPSENQKTKTFHLI
jgi:hypothetical protein